MLPRPSRPTTRWVPLHDSPKAPGSGFAMRWAADEVGWAIAPTRPRVHFRAMDHLLEGLPCDQETYDASSTTRKGCVLSRGRSFSPVSTVRHAARVDVGDTAHDVPGGMARAGRATARRTDCSQRDVRFARIRSLQQILSRLDRLDQREGLMFMPEMARFAGTHARVLRQLSRVFEYNCWREPPHPIYILDGLHCTGGILGSDGPATAPAGCFGMLIGSSLTPEGRASEGSGGASPTWSVPAPSAGHLPART